MTVTVNGKQRELAEGATGTDLLQALGISLATAVAEVNGQVIPRDQFASRPFTDGDVIELVTVVGGG